MQYLISRIFLFMAFFIAVVFVSATDILGQEGAISISGKDAWPPAHFDRVHFKQTKDVASIIAISSKERSLSADVDLLLHFNREQTRDATGNYQIVRQPVYSDKNVLFGRAAGFFQGRGGLVLRPSASAFLGYGITDHDFSINFWFYPFFAENGEILFEWEGQLKLGEDVIPQRIAAIFRSNRVVWQFRNVFLAPEQKYSFYEVSSEPYIPESWYQQRVLYDESNAMLEFLSDNRSQDVTYTTSDGTAFGSRTTLMVNNSHLTDFSIAPKFFGLLDEWEIVRTHEQKDLAPTLFYYSSGSAYSKVIDMGSRSAQVHKVRVSGQQPHNSKFLLYYAVDNDRYSFRDFNSLRWQRLQGDNGLFANLYEHNIVGKFIQFKIELFSDAKTQTTPSVEGLEIFYYRHRSPAPPSNILVDNYHQGGVYVQWQPSVNKQVLGYKIFMGKYSGQYLATGYPVDVGDKTSFLFSSLLPKVQYFFVVTSYDKHGRIGPFSKEYSIRHIGD